MFFGDAIEINVSREGWCLIGTSFECGRYKVCVTFALMIGEIRKYMLCMYVCMYVCIYIYS